MRRLLRCTMRLAAAVSALLCAAMLALWVRSKRVNEPDVLEFSRRDIRCSVESHGGRLRLSNDPQCRRWQKRLESAQLNKSLIGGFGGLIVVSDTPEERAAAKARMEREEEEWREAATVKAELELREALTGKPIPVELSVADATLAAVTGSLPGMLLVFSCLRLAMRSRRRRRGLCAACGFDLRASPHRCPECGARPAT